MSLRYDWSDASEYANDDPAEVTWVPQDGLLAQVYDGMSVVADVDYEQETDIEIEGVAV